MNLKSQWLKKLLNKNRRSSRDWCRLAVERLEVRMLLSGVNPNEVVDTALTPTQLAESLVGTGVSVSNVTFTGGALSTGSFAFTDPKVIGFGQGIVLSSGNAADVVGPNLSDSTSTDFGLPGAPNLDTLSTFPTFDAAVLEFDFTPTANQVVFQYAFASDEYPEWVYTPFNDVFAFYVNGTNYAEVRKVAGDPLAPFVPVAVNNINNGNPGMADPPMRPDLFRANYVNPNGGPSAIDLELDGITSVLTFQAPVNPGVPNHMKLAIADASDGIYNSAVFIQAGSLVSNENPVADLSLSPSIGSAPLTVTAIVEGEDPNGMPLTYTIDWGDGTPLSTGALPQNTALVDHTFTASGTHIVTLTVSNGTLSGTSTEDVDVTGGSNQAPTITSGNFTVSENTTAAGTVTATDPDAGTTLTFSLVGGADQALFSIDATTGALTFNTAPDFEAPADAGGDNVYDVTVQVTDGAIPDRQAITVTVTNVNESPTASDSSLTTNEDTATTGTLLASDIDSAVLTFSLVSTTNARGTVTITDATTGAFSYTPDANFNGLANFTFSASDGSLVSNIGTVTITVNAVNDAPTASNGSLTTDEDTATTGTLVASDIDSATLSFSLVSTANAHGSVTITNTATGAFSYTPDEDFSGSASFTFLANDGTLDSNIGTVTITVNPVNDMVVAIDGSLTTNEDTATTGTLMASDLDNSVLAYSLFSTTNAHGSVSITNNTTGAFSYTPDPNFSGSASFTFLANDGTVVSNIGTVMITVNAVNDAPSFTKGADQTGSLSSVAQTVPHWASGISAGPADEAGQLVNFLVSTNNDALFSVLPAISADGTLTYTLANNATGSATVSVRIHDNGGIADGGVATSDPQTFVISTVNRAPSFVKGANQSVLEDAGRRRSPAGPRASARGRMS